MTDNEERIEELVKSFNFKKVLPFTKLSETKLKELAKSLLVDAFLYGYASQQGLVATYELNTLSLLYVIEEVSEGDFGYY